MPRIAERSAYPLTLLFSRIWRSFSIGSLFDLIMLDTRNYDRSITTLDWNDEYVKHISNDASRTLMGSDQENW